MSCAAMIESRFPHKKVLVIGCPGSGKSTIARALASKTALPLYHLDMLYWNADKTTVAKEIFHARLAEILKKDAWIIDGNYVSTMDLRLQFCDAVCFLDFPTETCLDGVRSRFGKPRADMPWIETEEDAEFMDFIKRFSTETRPKIFDLLAKYPQKEVFTFHSREELNDWVEQL